MNFMKSNLCFNQLKVELFDYFRVLFNSLEKTERTLILAILLTCVVKKSLPREFFWPFLLKTRRREIPFKWKNFFTATAF